MIFDNNNYYKNRIHFLNRNSEINVEENIIKNFELKDDKVTLITENDMEYFLSLEELVNLFISLDSI